MVSLNLSKGKSYYTQRNNKIDPAGTCAPTSMIMALLYSGYTLPDCGDSQPEDVLTTYLRTDTSIAEYYRNNFPTEYGKNIPANEVAPVRAFGLNKWMGKQVNQFTWSGRMQDIIFSLIKGKACVVSGSWPYKRATGEMIDISHVVCVCGFESAQDNILSVQNAKDIFLSLLVSFIVDDPYGDYRTGYQDPNGNDVIVPYNDFNRIVREQGATNQKWVHFII